MLTSSLASLTEQVGSVTTLDSSQLDRVRHEALTAPRDWVAEYGDYQSGAWWTLSLMNATGDPQDVTIADCDPVATTLLDQMPATKQMLASLGLRYMWVRLARFSPNSFLWEHRDYGELSAQEHFRLHIPLQTNRSASLVIGGAKVHLRAGQLWRLVPTFPHGACNLLGPDRIHIILDCYGDEAFHSLVDDPQLSDTDASMLPAATQSDILAHKENATRLVKLGYRHAAEHSLLRMFYKFALPEGCVYDLVSETYAELGLDEDASAWTRKKALMLGLDESVEGVR